MATKKLSKGAFSYSSGGAGMVWFGRHPATQADKEALAAYFKKDVKDITFDEASLVGTFDANWNSASNAKRSPSKRSGGLGSFRYEHQKVGNGDQVRFAKRPIFYKTKEGKIVKGIPGRIGEYHRGPKGYNVEGAKPGTTMYNRIRVGREFFWNNKRKWYSMRNIKVDRAGRRMFDKNGKKIPVKDRKKL